MDTKPPTQPMHRKNRPTVETNLNFRFFGAVAWNISELRHTHGLTQVELATKTKLSVDQISNIERGLGRTSFETLITLADFFGVKVAQLCEDLPRGRVIKWRLRANALEGDTLKYARDFSEATKISKTTLSPRKFHKVQVQKSYIYDFIALSGKIMIEGPDVFETMNPQDIITLKGSGRLLLRSFSDVQKSEIIVIQSFVRDGN